MFGSQILHGFSYGITIPILWAMIADVDYSEWKTNRRATAIIFGNDGWSKSRPFNWRGLVTWILGL